MNNLSELYFNMQSRLFPMLEEEIGEITAKLQEFLRIIELVKPSRFVSGALSWCGLGRRMKSREKMLRAFFLKSVYDLPTSKVLIENLKGNSTWRQLCGWEFPSQVPSEATFSRAFSAFAKLNLLGKMHETVIKENYDAKLVGHASMDSTAIVGREKSCRKNTPKKKRGRKSTAEKAAITAEALAEVKTRRLELQAERSLKENLTDLPLGCDWGGKRNSKGKTEYWCGYKLHLSLADGGIPLAAILTSASPHDSQVAVPLMQMVSERATVLYDLADSAYDAPEIKEFSARLTQLPQARKSKNIF